MAKVGPHCETAFIFVAKCLNIMLLSIYYRFINKPGGCDIGPKYVCGNCIIGAIVPAFRPTMKQWNFGRIESFRAQTGEFCLQFGCDREWVYLEEDPLQAYVTNYTSPAVGASELASEEKSSHWPHVEDNNLFDIATYDGNHSFTSFAGQERIPEGVNHLQHDYDVDIQIDSMPRKASSKHQQKYRLEPCSGVEKRENDGALKTGPRLWTIDVSIQDIKSQSLL